MRAGSWTRPTAVTPPEPAGLLPLAVFVGSAAVPLLMVVVAVATGRSTSPLTWYLARASGFTLYLLLWASVALGLGLTTGLIDRYASRGLVYSLHRFVTALSYGFLSVHLLSLFIDEKVAFGLRDLAVPFAAAWGEPWTGIGVVAAYVLLGIGASSSILRVVPFRWWRAIHWFTFPLFLLALAHGLGAGTNSGSLWAQAIYAGTTATVLWLALYRALRGGRRMATRASTTSAPYDRMTARMGR